MCGRSRVFVWRSKYLRIFTNGGDAFCNIDKFDRDGHAILELVSKIFVLFFFYQEGHMR